MKTQYMVARERSMRVLNTRLLSMLALAALLLVSHQFQSKAQASFNCGSGWTLYTVGNGVRCVKYVPAANGEAAGYAWYGEGIFPNGQYRHIGVTRLAAGQTNRFDGTAADIHGNGEDFDAVWDGLMKLTRSTTTTYPATFSVAPWSETWTKAASASTTAYTSPWTTPATECGPNFYNHTASSKTRKYKAYLFADSTTDSRVGVRCVLGLTPGARDVWYGAGEIRTRASEGTNWTPTAWGAAQSYAHLGARSGTSYGQWDICQGTSFCVMRELGDLSVSTATLADTGNGVRVSAPSLGAELWIPSRRKHSLRLRPLRARDTDGNRSTPVSADDVRDLVARANAVYGTSADTELLYNRTLPAGAGGALSVVSDSTLNGFDQSGDGSSAYTHGDFYAKRSPSDVVAIFTWGAQGASGCPTGGGQSGGNWSWLSTVSLRSGIAKCGNHNLCGVFDDGQLAHELGHYIGIGHTFAGSELASNAAAVTRWEAKSCNATTAFDGDATASTAPDPMYAGLVCSSATTSVTLSSATCGSKTFTLPRNNIMSYYLSSGFPLDKTVTSGQATLIDGNLATSARKALE